MNVPRKVILHCSATRDSGNHVDAATIDAWHKDKGWTGIGYHFVIKRDGEIEQGRAEDAIGAHTLGQNKNSLGVCLVGTCDFTFPQIESLIVLYKRIKLTYCQIKQGHMPFSAPQCGFSCGRNAPLLGVGIGHMGLLSFTVII